MQWFIRALLPKKAGGIVNPFHLMNTPTADAYAVNEAGENAGEAYCAAF